MNNQNNSKQSVKSIIIKTAVIFVVAYIVSLLIWLLIKGYYGMAITTIASYLVSLLKGLDITEIVRNKDIISVGFITNKYGLTQVIKTTIDIPISNYTFNAPLTFAIMAAFYPFIKRKWLYLEALIILVVVHFLFVFTLEGQKLTAVMAAQGIENPGSVTIIFWQFLWGFVDNMVVRFEPFLIGAYLFLLRNKVSVKKVKPEKTPQKKAPPKKKKTKKKR
ncbi:MAG: exosortase H-associated membrane protein [Thermodesulfobacteriota bacterium]